MLAIHNGSASFERVFRLRWRFAAAPEERHTTIKVKLNGEYDAGLSQHIYPTEIIQFIQAMHGKCVAA